jgi:hypothetical protein
LLGQRADQTLLRGDWLTVQAPEQQFIDGLAPLLQEVSEHPFPTLALRSIRAGVETSTKKQFFARPNWDVALIIRKQFDTFSKIARPSTRETSLVNHLSIASSYTALYSMHAYEVRSRKDHRGVDVISDKLPFGRLWVTSLDDAMYHRDSRRPSDQE